MKYLVNSITFQFDGRAPVAIEKTTVNMFRSARTIYVVIGAEASDKLVSNMVLMYSQFFNKMEVTDKRK